MPFEKAAGWLADFTGMHMSEATARRQTEGAGAAYEAVQTAEVERTERELPPAPGGPTKPWLSGDGARVPLQPGEGGEGKTLVMGVVEEPGPAKGAWGVPTRELSDFSRLTDAETFGRLALVETQRRGMETACQVGAVTDGAEGAQGFLDRHRPDAVRILDFPHAAERAKREAPRQYPLSQAQGWPIGGGPASVVTPRCSSPARSGVSASRGKTLAPSTA